MFKEFYKIKNGVVFTERLETLSCDSFDETLNYIESVSHFQMLKNLNESKVDLKEYYYLGFIKQPKQLQIISLNDKTSPDGIIAVKKEKHKNKQEAVKFMKGLIDEYNHEFFYDYYICQVKTNKEHYDFTIHSSIVKDFEEKINSNPTHKEMVNFLSTVCSPMEYFTVV